ncbi:MAG: nucleotidyltransferase domain-containing protein [Nanoarchaeota archaeon]
MVKTLIITKEELKIVELFKNNLFGEYTIREIMKKINKKSYNWIFRAVDKLKKMGIIKVKTKGASSICSVDLDNQLTLNYFSLLEKLSISKKLPMKNILELIGSIPIVYFSFIIAGSYAEGKATKKSDLDVVVLVENKDDSKKIFTILKNKGELMIPPAHIYVFTKNEFLEMLLNKEQNYAKLIFEKKILIFGAENYYLIIKEAIENGFKG